MNDPADVGFSDAEYRRLLKELGAIRDERNLTINQIVEGTGLGEATVKRFLKGERSPSPGSFRQMKQYVESLRPLVSEARELETDLYHYLKRRMNVEVDYQRRQLRRFRGSYTCLRLSVYSQEVVSTYLKIWDQNDDGIPRFTHIETVPDERNVFGDAPRREYRHSGFLLARDRRLYFMSAGSGNFRQMIGVASSNQEVRDFAGILLSVDAIKRGPFAARVLVRFAGADREFGDLAANLGVFSLDDQKFAPVVPMLRNLPTDEGVLLPPDIG